MILGKKGSVAVGGNYLHNGGFTPPTRISLVFVLFQVASSTAPNSNNT